MRVVLIFNPESGRNRRSKSSEGNFDALLDELRVHGWSAAQASATGSAELVAAAKAALANGANIIVACGGDGTVSTIASVIAGTEATLGVIPMGTLNHFARDLKITGGLQNAARTLMKGHIQSVDMCDVNGLRFINNSSLGIYPNIVQYCEGRRKGGWSRIVAFAAACAVALRRFRGLKLSLEVDGSRSTRTSPFLLVGNNRYETEGLKLGSRQSLSEGRLCVYLADRTGRFGLLRIALSALVHRLRQNHDFVILPAEHLIVQTRRKTIAVALDGEVFHLHPPLHYSIHPGLLKVLTPGD